ncbi:MAG: TonB-dependent receptor, partial [Candidatus Latescibacteria bacterium]|nr:TonB-dependent receptor [Candidatus Latescibacterota bacterium]
GDDDEFFGDDEDFSLSIELDNRLYSVGWVTAISDVTLSDLTLSRFDDTWALGVESTDESIDFEIEMRKLAIDEDILHIASREHSLQGGLSIADQITDITVELNQDSEKFYEDNPDDRREDDQAIVHRKFRFQNAATLTSAYVQDEWKRFAPVFRALAGCRVDHSTFTRETVFSPRLSMTYMLRDDLALRAGWGYFHQAPNFVSLFERFERQIEWNIFETVTLGTEKAIHYLGGLEWDAGGEYTAKVEGYYKSLDHLVVLTDSTHNNIPNNSGSGFASGLELFFQKKPSDSSRLSGWISYSHSFTKEKTPEKDLYFRDFDQRHTLNVVSRLRLTKRISIDVTYGYGSGFPWTPVVEDEAGNPVFDDEGEMVWAKTNSARNPVYKRLDVRVEWERKLGEGRSILFYFEIINLLNRRNVYEYYWDNDYSTRLVSYMLPAMPFFGIRLEL